MKILFLLSLATIITAYVAPFPAFALTSFTSNQCTTQVGSAKLPTGTQPGCTTVSGGGGGGGLPGPCGQAPAPPGDIRGAIISKWGITLNLPQSQLQFAWEEFHEIDCTGLLQDLRGTLVDSWGEGYAQQFSCPGKSGAQGATDVMFSNQWNGEFMKAILIHEFTHVWQFCAPRGEQNRLEIPAAYSGEGGLTTYSKFQCPKFLPANLFEAHNEDHADTIALYLNPNQGELTCGNGAPNPFAGGRHPLHNGVAQRGLRR